MAENDFSSIPIEQRRGIETIDINLKLTLAFADIDSTINGLKKLALLITNQILPIRIF
jgi:hypothetical protein